MRTVISRDGTPIAYDRTGNGPSIILVDGALCHRGLGPSAGLARLLANRFTVYTYDRRGRGESGDAGAYDVEREIEDLEALAAEAGGSAALYGVSSGAALILEAAARLRASTAVMLFEPPFVVTDIKPLPADMWPGIETAIAGGDRSRALQLFLRGVGVPPFVIAVMRLLPIWRQLKATAHTLPYDGKLVREYQRGRPLPRGRWSAVTMPALVLVGGKSPDWMQSATQSLASILPNATHRVLPGQTHDVKPAVHAPIITDFVGRAPAMDGALHRAEHR